MLAMQQSGGCARKVNRSRMLVTGMGCSRTELIGIFSFRMDAIGLDRECRYSERVMTIKGSLEEYTSSPCARRSAVAGDSGRLLGLQSAISAPNMIRNWGKTENPRPERSS